MVAAARPISTVPATNATFTRGADGRVSGRPVYLYDYSVEQENTNWILVSPDGSQFKAPYKGQIAIDRETRRVLKIEQRAVSIPKTFPQDKAETTIEFGFIRIDAGIFLLPVRSETRGCTRNTVNCFKNEIVFRNYRKFAADSSIKFD